MASFFPPPRAKPKTKYGGYPITMVPSCAYLVGGISSRATTHPKERNNAKKVRDQTAFHSFHASIRTQPQQQDPAGPPEANRTPESTHRREYGDGGRIVPSMSWLRVSRRKRRPAVVVVPSQQPGPSALAFGARECRAATNAACAGVGKRGTALSRGNSRKRTMTPLFAA